MTPISVGSTWCGPHRVVNCPLQGICWKVQIFFTASEFLFSFVSIRYHSLLKSKHQNSSCCGLSMSNHRSFHKRTTCSQEISYSLIIAKLGKRLFSRYYSIGDAQIISIRILFKMSTAFDDTPDNSWSLNLGRIWFSGPKCCCIILYQMLSPWGSFEVMKTRS